MPQSLNEFLLRLYALDDRVWAGITRKLLLPRQTNHAQGKFVQGLWHTLQTPLTTFMKTKWFYFLPLVFFKYFLAYYILTDTVLPLVFFKFQEIQCVPKLFLQKIVMFQKLFHQVSTRGMIWQCLQIRPQYGIKNKVNIVTTSIK